MAAPQKMIAALRRYGAASAGNKTQLETWRTEALTALAENKGASLSSVSANGVSGAFGGNDSMSLSDWYAALDAAIVYVDQGIAPPSRTFVRIF